MTGSQTDQSSFGEQATIRAASPDIVDAQEIGRVDRYALLEKAGEGGFGSVWKARDTETRLDVAIKVLPPLVAANADELERVRRNFALVSNLTHPNICTLRYLHRVEQIDAAASEQLGIGPGSYIVVMDYVDGTTLTRYRLDHGGTLPLDEAIAICRQVAGALDYAHSQKIIHRDIKPGNIMVQPDGVAKILDFGLAAEIRCSMSRVSQEVTNISGTRPYMAPEQWRGQKQDARADQYALAVLIYELLAGHCPFENPDTGILREAVLHDEPEQVRGLPMDMWHHLAKALSKSRVHRYEKCSELVLERNSQDVRWAEGNVVTSDRSADIMPEVHDGSVNVAVGAIPATNQLRLAMENDRAKDFKRYALALVPTLDSDEAASAILEEMSRYEERWLLLAKPVLDACANEAHGHEVRLLAARLLARRGRWREAKRIAESILERAPGNPHAAGILKQTLQAEEARERRLDVVGNAAGLGLWLGMVGMVVGTILMIYSKSNGPYPVWIGLLGVVSTAVCLASLATIILITKRARSD
jgi:serine/threonine protein kinase